MVVVKIEKSGIYLCPQTITILDKTNIRSEIYQYLLDVMRHERAYDIALTQDIELYGFTKDDVYIENGVLHAPDAFYDMMASMYEAIHTYAIVGWNKN